MSSVKKMSHGKGTAEVDMAGGNEDVYMQQCGQIVKEKTYRAKISRQQGIIRYPRKFGVDISGGGH